MKKIFLFILGFIAFNSAMAQTDSMTHYVGKYTFPDGSPVKEITVVYESGALSATSAMGNTELRKTSQVDVFDIVAFGGTATFKRNSEGKVISVQIVVGDVNMEGTRSDGSAIFLQNILNQSFRSFVVENKASYNH